MQLNFRSFLEKHWNNPALQSVLTNWEQGRLSSPEVLQMGENKYELTAERLIEENTNEKHLILVTIRQL